MKELILILGMMAVVNGLWPQRVNLGKNNHWVSGNIKTIDECFGYGGVFVSNHRVKVICINKNVIRWSTYNWLDGDCSRFGPQKEIYYSKNGENGYKRFRDKWTLKDYPDVDFNCDPEWPAILGIIIACIAVIVGGIFLYRYIKKRQENQKQQENIQPAAVYPGNNTQMYSNNINTGNGVPMNSIVIPNQQVWTPQVEMQPQYVNQDPNGNNYSEGRNNIYQNNGQQIPVYSYVTPVQQNVTPNGMQQVMNQSLPSIQPAPADVALDMLSSANVNTTQNDANPEFRKQTGEM